MMMNKLRLGSILVIMTYASFEWLKSAKKVELTCTYNLSSLDLIIWSILCKPLICNRWSKTVHLLRLLEELFETGIVVSVSQLRSKAEAIYLRFESSVAMYAAAAAIALAVVEMKVAVLVVIVTVAPVMEAMSMMFVGVVVALHLWFAA